ncbi:hypothetical protein SDC9_105513 [bioreactor metagenome]|uniref:Uncharacterized protein n=1 Tax=bioreactor metagenome TaxID=1076179 RepID=A0A645AZR7_9ZZZZ
MELRHRYEGKDLAGRRIFPSRVESPHRIGGRRAAQRGEGNGQQGVPAVGLPVDCHGGAGVPVPIPLLRRAAGVVQGSRRISDPVVIESGIAVRLQEQFEAVVFPYFSVPFGGPGRASGHAGSVQLEKDMEVPVVAQQGHARRFFHRSRGGMQFEIRNPFERLRPGDGFRKACGMKMERPSGSRRRRKFSRKRGAHRDRTEQGGGVFILVAERPEPFRNIRVRVAEFGSLRRRNVHIIDKKIERAIHQVDPITDEVPFIEFHRSAVPPGAAIRQAQFSVLLDKRNHPLAVGGVDQQGVTGSGGDRFEIVADHQFRGVSGRRERPPPTALAGFAVCLDGQHLQRVREFRRAGIHDPAQRRRLDAAEIFAQQQLPVRRFRRGVAYFDQGETACGIFGLRPERPEAARYAGFGIPEFQSRQHRLLLQREKA